MNTAASLAALWHGPGQAAWHDGTHPRRERCLAAWLLSGGAVVLMIGLAWGRGLALMAGLVFLIIVSSTAWSLLCTNLLLQNQAVLARLVPGHVARLRATLWLGWAGLAGLGLLLSWAWLGSPLRIGLSWALWLLVLAWGMRAPLLWAVAWMPLALWPWAPSEGTLALAWQSVHQGAAARPFASGGLVLLAGAALLAPLLQTGGAGHARWYSTWTAQRAAARASGGAAVLHGHAGTHASDSLAGRLAAQFRRPARWAMARAQQRALTARTDVLPRLLLALGPGAQSGVQAMTVLGYSAVFVVLAGLFRSAIALGWLPPAERMSGLGNASFAALAFSLSLLQQTRVAVARTAAERALLSLAPGHRGQPGLPRRLVLHLLLQFQGLCAITFIVVALAIPGSAVLSQALVFWTVAAFSGLALCWPLTPNATRTGQPQLALQQVFVLPMVLAGSLMLAMALGAVSLQVWLAVAASMAVLGGSRAWWRLARQPALFAPAARG